MGKTKYCCSECMQSSLMAMAILAHLFFTACQGAFIGFDYVTKLSAAPDPKQVVNLLKLQQVGNIRLYEPHAPTLQALSKTGIEVIVGIPNEELLSVGGSASAAYTWVKNNVLAYLPDTNITGISVGNEVLTSHPNSARLLLPAMRGLHSTLTAANLHRRIKISTPISTSLILDSFPPSQAFFNRSWDGVMVPLLGFLSKTNSYLMLNVHCFDIYKENEGVITLDYALGVDSWQNNSNVVVDSNNALQYNALFEAVLDSAFHAMETLNHSSIPIVVSETGWPSKGDPDASPENASTFTSNLIARILNNTGTPKHPKASINTFLFQLLDGANTGPFTYGLFNSSTLLPAYRLRLSGSGPLLANDTLNPLYCVAKPGADIEALQIVLDWTCGPGRANCSATLPGQPCYEPDAVASHASYAFDSYFQMSNKSLGSCDFNGLATVTTTNPSYGSCIYPGSFNATMFRNTTTSSAPISTSTGNGTANSSAFAISACWDMLAVGTTTTALTMAWLVKLF